MEKQKYFLLSFIFGIGIIWAILIYSVFVITIPHNILSLPRKYAKNLITIIPEGWSFFTRNPREDKFYLYSYNESAKAFIPLNKLRTGNRENWFGLKKDARAMGGEYALIVNKIEETDWKLCEENVLDFFQTNMSSMIFKPVLNTQTFPLLCGKILIIRKPIVPWAWARDFKGDMPSKYLLIDILCK